MKKGFYFLVASFLFAFVSLTNVDASSHHYTFDTKGGSPATIEAIDGDDTNGDVLDIPEVTKEGSIFGGWCYFDESMATPAYPDGMEVCLEGNEVKNWHPETVELYAKWITPINTIDVTIKLPEIGTKIESGSTTPPIAESDVTVPSGAGYTAFPEGAGLIKSYDDASAFVGTIEEGKDYYVELMIVPTSGSVTSETKIKINGKETYKIGEYYVDEDGNLDPEAANNPWGFLVYAKVTAEEEEPPTYEYLEGANQSYTLNDDETASFRIDADYSLFEEGGKVYVDDKLVDSKNYTSKSGSTIITFTKDFMSNLSAGAHTLKVVFNNEGVATTSFTVKAKETAAANETTTETTSTEATTETTKATTKKSTKNPKTGDSIITYIVLLGLSIIGIISLGIYNKKLFN